MSAIDVVYWIVALAMLPVVSLAGWGLYLAWRDRNKPWPSL